MTFPRTTGIPHIRALSDRAFAKHVEGGWPLIIEDGAMGWPAIGRWTPEYLRSMLASERRVRSRRTPSTLKALTAAPFGDYMSSLPETDDGVLPIHTFLDRCADGEARGSTRELYVPGMQAPRELLSDFELPAFLRAQSIAETNLFFGRNTHCIGHFHYRYEAVLVQVAGTKKVQLFHPRDARDLYLFPAWTTSFNRSRVNFANIDFELFPKLRDVTCFEAVLSPGEALYIPIHWLHFTAGAGWSVSLTFFWDARLRDWAFPSPGIRSLAWTQGRSLSSKAKEWFTSHPWRSPLPPMPK